eukprot:8726081-Alexandrium_andersonii.AAC.1
MVQQDSKGSLRVVPNAQRPQIVLTSGSLTIGYVRSSRSLSLGPTNSARFPLHGSALQAAQNSLDPNLHHGE